MAHADAATHVNEILMQLESFVMPESMCICCIVVKLQQILLVASCREQTCFFGDESVLRRMKERIQLA